LLMIAQILRCHLSLSSIN